MNIFPLLNLLKDGQFHSGEHLSLQLGLTRASVWKQVHKIKQQLGVEIEAVTGKGYRIPGGIDLLDFEKLQEDLKAIIPIVAEPIMASTNDYLLDHIKTIANPTPLAVLTEQQTAGRGRHGKRWHSPFAKNIMFSVYWPIQGDFHQLAGLSLILAIACTEALQSLGIEVIEIKWPNDLYAQGKKLAGILVETQREAEGLIHAVIGIGINHSKMRDVSQIDQAFTCLEEITTNLPSRHECIVALIRAVKVALEKFGEHGFSAFLPQWPHFDMLANKRIEITRQKEVLQGYAKGVNKLGHLQLEIDGSIVVVDSGYDKLRILDEITKTY